MIFVDRTSLSIPWNSEKIVREDIEYIMDNNVLSNDEFSFREINDTRKNIVKRNRKYIPKIKKCLVELFGNKCAYCEIFVSDIYQVIDNFRPNIGVVDVKSGKAYPLHYLWLKNSWDNLYLCCPECNSNKVNKFPLAGEVAELFATGDKLLDEYPLLLDPCDRMVLINEHLNFLAAGIVAPLSERGEATINVLDLNRPSLVSARKLHATSVLALLAQGADEAEIKTFLDEQNRQFLALTRQLISGHTKRVVKKSDYRLKTLNATKSEIRLYGPKIERIILKDIGPISGKHTLELNIVNGNSDKDSSWLMFLGDNGVGKSTILKMTALLLAGEERSSELLSLLKIKFNDFLRTGAKQGYIKLLFTSNFPPKELVITPDEVRFSDSAKGLSPIILNAYGASRLHPNARHPAQERTDTCFIDSLFDNFEPLSDVNHFILSLDAKKLAYTVASLSQLFGKGRHFDITINTDSVEGVCFILDKKNFTFSQLSDGFKSLICLYMDIANTAMNLGFERAEDFNGIVVIDELGTHLHPRWRMNIVRCLRNLFPQTQFLCSTHEPLCLRGLKNHEVKVLRRFNGKVKFVDDLPPVNGLTAEQLLTSVHFGLSSTIDPDIEVEFKEYYALLYRQGRGEHLSEESVQRLKVLQDKLAASGAGSGIFSGTRRDQLVYRAIDKLIAENQERDVMASLDKSQIEELDGLWLQASGH